MKMIDSAGVEAWRSSEAAMATPQVQQDNIRVVVSSMGSRVREAVKGGTLPLIKKTASDDDWEHSKMCGPHSAKRILRMRKSMSDSGDTPEVKPLWTSKTADSKFFEHNNIRLNDVVDGKNGESKGVQTEGVACPASMRRPHWCVADYLIKRKLYQGATSKVYKAMCKTSGMTVALKIYIKRELHPVNVAQVKREIAIHSMLCHTNIIGMYGAFEDDDYYFVVLEYADGGDLFGEMRKRIGLMPDSEVMKLVLVPALEALNYLHKQGIIHRDLKPENVLFTKEKIFKLADFGLSINQDLERPVTRAGTLEYMPPEVIKNPPKATPQQHKDKPELAYDEKADTWALSVMIYELLHGFPAFGRERDDTFSEVSNKIQRMSVRFFPDIRSLSTEAQDFLRANLSKDPSHRMSVQEMMSHDWIKIFSPDRRRSIAFAQGSKRQVSSNRQDRASLNGGIQNPQYGLDVDKSCGDLGMRRLTSDNQRDSAQQRPSLLRTKSMGPQLAAVLSERPGTIPAKVSVGSFNAAPTQLPLGPTSVPPEKAPDSFAAAPASLSNRKLEAPAVIDTDIPATSARLMRLFTKPSRGVAFESIATALEYNSSRGGGLSPSSSPGSSLRSISRSSLDIGSSANNSVNNSPHSSLGSIRESRRRSTVQPGSLSSMAGSGSIRESRRRSTVQDSFSSMAGSRRSSQQNIKVSFE